MSDLNTAGVRLNGLQVVGLYETEAGADLYVRSDTLGVTRSLTADELDHVAARAKELATNARRKAVSRSADLPAVVSPAGAA